MSKSFKLKNNNYWDSTGIIHNNLTLKYFLENFVTLKIIHLGNLTDVFPNKSGFLEQKITVPANTLMIVTGIHTPGISASNGLQITNAYNGTYINSSDDPITISYYLNYSHNGISEEQTVDLNILYIKIK